MYWSILQLGPKYYIPKGTFLVTWFCWKNQTYSPKFGNFLIPQHFSICRENEKWSSSAQLLITIRTAQSTDCRLNYPFKNMIPKFPWFHNIQGKQIPKVSLIFLDLLKMPGLIFLDLLKMPGKKLKNLLPNGGLMGDRYHGTNKKVSLDKSK